ncbi:MAG: hypothetical protein QM571_07590 [Micrococcaceae bacterium]
MNFKFWTVPVPQILRYTRATQSEIATSSPADDLMPENSERSIRCITIAASTSTVYRWLCQLTLAPYSFDTIDFLGRRSPRKLVPGAGKIKIGQNFLIFSITDFKKDSYIAGISRPEFARIYGDLAVSYTVIALENGNTRLRANLCVANRNKGFGLFKLFLAAGDKIMAGRQLRVLKACAEGTTKQVQLS